MELTHLISRLRTEIGDQATPFRSIAQGDNETQWIDLVQPNVNPIGFSVTVVNGADDTVLATPGDYTVDTVNGQVMFTAPMPLGATIIIQGTTYGMFSDNELLEPIRDAVRYHCSGRTIDERYTDKNNFITYRHTAVGLLNLPPEEELPLLVLSTLNTYWMLADDMALDVNVQTAESTAIDRTARYQQVMHHIDELDSRYKELCSLFNIGPYRMETLNLRRVSHTNGRLVPLQQSREYDDHQYPTRLLPPIDGRYADNSGIPSQLFYGAGL
jgi:hypothetical protein